jgi:restriction endonuclease S subunit
MKVKLDEIADVTTGYIKRENNKPAEPINIPIIQLRDLSVNGMINYSEVKVEEINKSDRYPQLNAGDVIFAAKGSRRGAAAIDRDIAGLTASNHYLLIKIRDEFKNKLLPGYLAFYLRQKPAMDYFEQCSAGSYIPFISAAALKELEIELPPVEKQKNLAELGELIGREEDLEKKLGDLKKNYYKSSVEQFIKAGK